MGWVGISLNSRLSCLLFSLTQEAKGWLRRQAGNTHSFLGVHRGNSVPGWNWPGDWVWDTANVSPLVCGHG